MMKARYIDKRIDKVWYDVFMILERHQDDFISSNGVSPTNEDRKKFIEDVRKKSEPYSRMYKFTYLITKTRFYKMLYLVSINEKSMSKIRLFYDSIKNGMFNKLSSAKYTKSLNFLYFSKDPDLKNLCSYLYEQFIDRKDVKKYYFCLNQDQSIKTKLKIQSNRKGWKCPYCDSKMVNGDPDHFLPKSQFPLLALYSENIIFCCKNCNMGLKSKDFILPIVFPYEIDVIGYVQFKYINKSIVLEVIPDPKLQVPIENYLKVIKIIELYNNERYSEIFIDFQRKLFQSKMDLDKMKDFYKFSNIENKWDLKIREDFICQLYNYKDIITKYSTF